MAKAEISPSSFVAESTFVRAAGTRRGNSFAHERANAISKAIGYALTVGGVVVLVWTILGFDSPNPGKSAASPLLGLTIGAGLVFSGLSARSAWRWFAALLSLALAGQAASLLMIDAGRSIHFQHYRSISELVWTHQFELFVFCLQTVIVGVAFLKCVKPLWAWIRRNFRWWQLAPLTLVILFSVAAVTRDPGQYANDILIAASGQIVSMMSLILIVRTAPASAAKALTSKLRCLLADPTDDRRGVDRLSVVAALWVTLLSAALSFFVYQAHPHVPDESQYLFQARYLAAGQLTAKPPVVPKAFSMYMVPFKEKRWFGIFSPGWPVLLAAGQLAGLAWLVNPLLAGMCVLLVYVLFQDIYGRGYARIALLLLCFSPWLLFMSMSLMSHIATLTFALAGAVFLSRGLANRSHGVVLLSGLAVGIVSLIRPLDGLIVAVVLGTWILAAGGTIRCKLSLAVIHVVGMIAMASLIFPYNQIVTGSAGIMPTDAYYDKYFWPKVMALGFGPERGMGWGLDAFPGHTPFEALINAALNTYQLNTETFGWAIGSLTLVALATFSGGFARKDIWAVFSAAVVIGVYSLFWYHGGPDFGPRYWFLCIIPMIALTISAIKWMNGTISNGRIVTSLIDARLFLALLVLSLSTLLVYIPWRASDKYFGYLGMRPDIQQLARQHNFGRSLILIRGDEHPDYQSAWVYNPVNFEGDLPIYAHDTGPDIRTELFRSYWDRKVWIVEGPSIAHGEYRIDQGPLDASQLLADPEEKWVRE